MPAIATAIISGTMMLFDSVSSMTRTVLILIMTPNHLRFLHPWWNGYLGERISTILRLMYATVITPLFDFPALTVMSSGKEGPVHRYRQIKRSD